MRGGGMQEMGTKKAGITPRLNHKTGNFLQTIFSELKIE